MERSVNISGSSLGTGLDVGWGAMAGVLAARERAAAGVTVNGATVGEGEAVTVEGSRSYH